MMHEKSCFPLYAITNTGVVCNMIVNSTEVNNNFKKYLELASGQEIVIIKNGTAVARLVGIGIQNKSLSEQMRGLIPSEVDEKLIKTERLSRH